MNHSIEEFLCNTKQTKSKVVKKTLLYKSLLRSFLILHLIDSHIRFPDRTMTIRLKSQVILHEIITNII